MTYEDGMAREILVPTNRQEWLNARVRDITSTEIAALFGCSPYTTHFELWHRKKDSTVEILEENERMKWGTRLQDSIAQGIATDNGFAIRRMEEYVSIPSVRMGASFDFSVESTPFGLLEIKNVDGLVFQQGWIEDEHGNIEAPPHIELQVQHQLAVSGRSFAYIGALVGGNRVVLIRRLPDSGVIEAVKQAVSGFWKSIEDNNPPAPDFGRDAAFIARLYNRAEAGKVFDATGDEHIESLMMTYQNYGKMEKEAKEGKDAIKAEILTRIGTAEKVLGGTFTLSTGVIPECLVEAFTRKSYRAFKPSFKKEKK